MTCGSCVVQYGAIFTCFCVSCTNAQDVTWRMRKAVENTGLRRRSWRKGGGGWVPTRRSRVAAKTSGQEGALNMKLVLSSETACGGGSEESAARQSTNASLLLTRRMCTTTRLPKGGGGPDESSHMLDRRQPQAAWAATVTAPPGVRTGCGCGGGSKLRGEQNEAGRAHCAWQGSHDAV